MMQLQGAPQGGSLLPPTPDAFWGLARGPSTARRQTEKPPGGSASCEPAQAGEGRGARGEGRGARGERRAASAGTDRDRGHGDTDAPLSRN